MEIQRLQDGCLLIDLHTKDWVDVVPRLVADAVEQLAQARPNLEWDRLRAYTRFDSGLIWLSLEPGQPSANTWVAGIELRCMEELYFALPNADADPAGFEEAHDALSQRVFDLLRQSALIPPARAALATLQRLKPHALTFVEYDDLETDRVLVSASGLAES